jgi:hypothetical protein
LPLQDIENIMKQAAEDSSGGNFTIKEKGIILLLFSVNGCKRDSDLNFKKTCQQKNWIKSGYPYKNQTQRYYYSRAPDKRTESIGFTQIRNLIFQNMNGI